ncbi:hypothetical protein BH20ACI1_BH20ACI1_11160 [soil metagenome]
MRFFTLFLLLVSFSFGISAQTRQQAIEKFKDLKDQAEIQEKIILSPDKKDVEEAKQENVGVFRLLPRETYDKGLFTTRGGGAFYSFYYKIPDYGYGSDIMLEQGRFSTSNVGLMIDLGEVPLNEITKESPSADGLINYQSVKKTNSVYQDFSIFRYEGLNYNGLVYTSHNLPPVTGHTYVVRSMREDYYDVLVAFNVKRKDADGSLVIFWKLLEQFDTPKRENSQKARLSDEEITKNTQGWLRGDYFSKVKAEVNNGVISLHGMIEKDKLAYAIQLSNSSGATKVLNFLTVK